MKNPKMLTLTQAVKVIGESRLIYMGNLGAPSASPQASPAARRAPSARATRAPSQNQTPKQLKDKLKKRAEKLLAKWEKMGSGQHSPEFKALINGYIAKVKSGLTKTLKSKTLAKAARAFTSRLNQMTKKVTVAKALEKAKKALNEDAFKKAKKAAINAVLKKVPQAYNSLKPSIRASLERSLGTVQSEIQKLLSSLGSQIANAKHNNLAQITAQIKKLPTSVPKTIDALLKKVALFPTLQKMLLEIKEYLEALKYIYNADAMGAFIGAQCTTSGNCGKALAQWKKKVAAWAKDPSKMPKGKKLVDAVLKAQTRIIMSQVLDMLKDKKHKKLLKDLMAALKRIPGAIGRNNEIQIDAVLKFLQNYDSFQNVGAEVKRKVALLLAKAVKAVSIGSKGLNIDMIVEGGADARAIAFRPALKGKYNDLQGVAKRLMDKVTKGKGLRALPQVSGYESELSAFAQARNAYAFLSEQTNKGKNKTAMKKWFGAEGVLNTLLFISRAEDMAGKLGSQDNLFTNPNCRVGGSATARGVVKAADRYSRVSFIARNSNLRQATTPAAAPQAAAAAGGRRGATAPASAAAPSAAATPATPAASTTPPAAAATGGRRATPSAAATPAAAPSAAPAPAPTPAQPQTPAQSPNQAPSSQPAPLSHHISTDIPTPEQGKTAKYQHESFSKTQGGKFLIEGHSHALTEEEFRIVVGEKRPTEAYMKSKVSASYIRSDIPLVLSYEAYKKLITGKYTSGNITLTITYNIKMGERVTEITPKKASIKPFLPTTTKMAVLKALLADGWLLPENLQIATDPQETTQKSLKEHLVKREWKEALGILLKAKTKDMPLIASCVSAAAADDFTHWDSVKSGLKPLLPQIIANYPIKFNDKDLKAFTAISDGKLEAPVYRALLKSEKLTGTRREKTIVAAIKAFPDDPSIATYYLDEVFGGDADKGVSDNIKIKAIKAYPGDFKDTRIAVAYFINDKYHGNFNTNDFKPRIYAYFAAVEAFALPNDGDELFKKLFPTTQDIESLAQRPKGAEVWGKYMYQQEKSLMETNVDQLFTASSSNMLNFINAWANITPEIEVGKVDKNNKAKAINILKRISPSKHPVVIKATEELLAAIKKVGGSNDKPVKDVEAKEQERMKTMFAVAIGTTPVASYMNRALALKMFISGPYRNKDVNGVRGGEQGNYRLNRMKGLLANLYYDNGEFRRYALTDDLVSQLSKERQEFLGYYRHLNTLTEPAMLMIMKEYKKIGIPAIRALAIKLDVYDAKVKSPRKESAGQALRLYKFIGMEERAAEMLTFIKDKAEKAFLKTMLDYVDKRYGNMSSEQRKKVKKGLMKAYKKITTTGQDTTPTYVQMQIIEELFKLGTHMDPRQKDEILALLDQDAGKANGYLNTLAKQNYNPSKPKKPTYKESLILRAKELRAKVEVEQARSNPDKADVAALALDIDDYRKALGKSKKPLDKFYADILKKAYREKGKKLTGDAKKAFARIMLQAAEQKKDKKYLVGGFNNANLDIKADDFDEDTEKVRYYVVLGEYLKAAKIETDDKKAEALIDKSTKSAEKKAAAYAKVATPSALYKAAEFYITAKKYTMVETIMYYMLPSSGNHAINNTKARTLITSMPNVQIKIRIASMREFKKLAFETFKTTQASHIDIDMLTGNNAPKPEEVMEALKVAEREITGDTKKKKELLNTIKRLSAYAALTPQEQKNIEDSLTK